MSIVINRPADVFLDVQTEIKTACDALKLDPAVYEIIKEPARVLAVKIPVRMDNGKVKVFTGYRSQHTEILGPCKGGIRFFPEGSLSEVKALSMWMTMKSSVVGLPYGGAKGLVLCNPPEMSRRELEELSRGYIRAIASFIGPDKDIPAPDVFTNAQVMGWMMDEYAKLNGRNVPAVITGKPIILGGSLGRVEATARGCVIAIQEAAKRLEIDLSQSTAVIQGHGNVGANAHALLEQLGTKVIAVSDMYGAVYNPEGLDYASLAAYEQETKSVKGFPGGWDVPRESVLTMKTDILIPAAVENVITKSNAANVQARIIAEAANGPISREADAIFQESNTFIIPDIIANSGGVTVSYFEWVQNNTGEYWLEDEINTKLERIMKNAFRRVYDFGQDHKVSLRTAAYRLAVSRLAEAMQARGII